MKLSYEQAIQQVVAVLEFAKTSKQNALSTAKALVQAESEGLKGHGLNRLHTYAAQSLSGKVHGFATPSFEQLAPALGRVDAAHGFAYPALELAEKKLIEMVKTQGIAAIGVSRSHHCGACGQIVERLAQQGLIALMFANTPAAIAPWGGKTGVFGTNPIAFATPLQGRPPAVVDLSLSVVARGNLVANALNDVPIPDNWALDVDGNPTTDAKKGLKGTMRPMGEAKGVALAFMVEVLAAGLTGADFAAQASSFLEAEGAPPNTGQLMIAIDPLRFNPHFTTHMETLIQDILTQQGTRLSGEKRLEMREKTRKEGIIFHAGVIREAEALGYVFKV